MNQLRPYLMPNKEGWLKSRGRVVYDPNRGKMKKNVDWWCVLEVDPEITRYYRWWVDRKLLNITMEPKHGLAMPSGGSHISIIRGANDLRQVPPLERDALWKKYHGREVDFLYHPNVRYSGDTTGNDRPNHYWFLDIESPFLSQIREEFGIPYDWRLHLTIGRTLNENGTYDK